MAEPLVALAGVNPAVNTTDSFAKGALTQEKLNSDQLETVQRGIQIIGSAALASMGGKLDGKADPAQFDAIIGDLEKMGLKQAGIFRGRADAAPGLAQASLTAMQRLALAKSDREYAQTLQEFDLKVKSLANAERKLAAENPAAQAAARAGLAQQYGLDPNSPGGKQYTLTGKLPADDQLKLTATDKTAILEADEMVNTNRAGIKALDEGMKLSPQTNSGWLASQRASLAQNLPDALVPDRISSKESASATQNYDNVVIGQALSQLKAIFGGAPTEGERKILIDLQASLDKPDNVRQEILGRAKAAAEARLKFNEDRATQLRGGTYYKPQGGAAIASGGPQAAASSPPVEGARQAPDGKYYVQKDGKWFRVD